MIVFFILIGMALLFAEWISLRRPINRIRYRCRPESVCHEPGEVFTLETVVENYSGRNFRELWLQERFPASMCTNGGRMDQVPEGERFMTVTSAVDVRRHQRLCRRRNVSMSERGHYILPGAVLSCGDFLGLRVKKEEISQWEELVIYPAREEEPELSTVLDGYYGDISVRRFLIEDPVLVNGFHEYTGTEPQRAISWTQSARRGSLMVKEYDYTQDLSATVLLNVHDRDFARTDIVFLETAFRLTRTVCEYLEEKRVRYRFFHNAVCAGTEDSDWQFPELGTHLEQVLEMLGRATYFSAGTLEKLAERAARGSAEQQAIYLITSERGEEISRAEEQLGREGAKVYVLYAEDYAGKEERA